MFATRMRLAVATVALATAAPLAAMGTATAASDAEAAAKPEREITINGKEPKEGKFVITGKVGPSYENRFVTVQRKLKSENNWNDYRKTRTNNKSRYREEIEALKRPGIVCYRVKVKGNDTFRTSYSKRVCIRTFRA